MLIHDAHMAYGGGAQRRKLCLGRAAVQAGSAIATAYACDRYIPLRLAIVATGACRHPLTAGPARSW
jgi:hypothetical protein